MTAAVRTLGRFLEPAMWVLVALDERALGLTSILDAVRALDGPMGHGTLLGTVARLERLRLVESAVSDDRGTMYRLTTVGRRAATTASFLRSLPA